MKFRELLELLDDGNVEQRLDESLAELILDVQKTVKPGTLTLVLTLKPDNSELLSATMTSTTKNPQPGAYPTKLFVTEEGELSTRNPRQKAFDFKRSE